MSLVGAALLDCKRVTSLPWQEAYLGVSLILGEGLDEAVGALAEPPAGRFAARIEALRSGSRETRARAIAGAVAQVVAGLEEIRLR